MSKRDYYEVLGISKGASDADIKAAYRRLASKYHPDKVQEAEKASAETSFKEAKEAYEALSVPDKRAQYDQYGHNSPGFSHRTSHTNGWQDVNPQDFADIFGSIFKNSGTFQQPRHPTHLVNISLADAYTGRTINLNIGGTTATLNIPPGARSNTKFYVDGNFYKINVQQHHKFLRSTDDLLVDVEISAIEAMLGVEAILEHLDSAKLQFTIPAGIQPGQIVKLTGKGMKNPESDRFGDMLVRITVAIPKTLTDDQKNILKTIAHRESLDI